MKFSDAKYWILRIRKFGIYHTAFRGIKQLDWIDVGVRDYLICITILGAIKKLIKQTKQQNKKYD